MYIYIYLSFLFLQIFRFASLSGQVKIIIINQQYAYATCKTKVHKK